MERTMRNLFVLSILVVILAACDLQGDALTIRTADERLTIGVRLLQPPAPPIAPAVLPTEEPSLLPTVTPTPCPIKGNIAADGTRIAHSPGQANYDNVVISPEKGEKCFATLDEAIAEGWRAAQR